MGFPCGLAGKEPVCNAGDLGLVPGLGRSPGEGKATHCSILAWRIPWSRKELEMTERLSLHIYIYTHKSIITVKIMNTAVTPQCSFVLFCNVLSLPSDSFPYSRQPLICLLTL